MKSAFCLTLLCFCTIAQAQIILGPQPGAPAAPTLDLKMIEPSKSEPTPKISPDAAQPEALNAPEAKKPKVDPAKKDKSDEPTIIDADESQFDPKSGIHTFIGNVKVVSPTFTMTTDGKLDVKMKDTKKTPPPPPAPTPAPGDKKADVDAKKGDAKGDPKAIPPAKAKPAGDDGETTSEIDTAIASGKLSTVRQIGPDGKIKEGIGRVIIYKSDKGTLTLKEWPQVQSGKNRIIATDGSTIMILDKDNHLDVKGPATTKLEPDKDPNKPPAKPAAGADKSATKAASKSKAK